MTGVRPMTAGRRMAGLAAWWLAGSMVVAGGLGTVFAGGPAAAAPEPFAIRRVDTTQFPRVAVTAITTGGPIPSSRFTLKENGDTIADPSITPIATSGTKVGTVLALDISDGMKDENRLSLEKKAAKAFVSHKNPGDQVAVIAVGSAATEVTGFTSDVRALSAAIDSLAPGGERSQWDAVSLGVGLFSSQPGLQRNLILVTSGKDTFSKIDENAAEEEAVSNHTAVFVVGIATQDLEVDALQQLAVDTGGAFQASSDASVVGQMLSADQQTLNDQYVITYTSKATTSTLDLELTAGTLRAESPAIGLGAVTDGVSQAQVVRPNGPSFLHSSDMKYLVGLLVVLAVALGAWAVISIAVKEESTLSAAIRPYSDAPAEDEERGRRNSLTDSGIVQRAVDITGKLAQDRGILEKIEKSLDEANLPLRAAEALFFYVAAVIVLSVAALFVKGLFAGVIVLAVVGAVPWAALNYAVTSRRKKFTSQLPDMLQLLSGTLRAGYSLLQGLEASAEEVDDPMGHELRRVLGEARLGRPLEEALEDCAERMGSDDFSWAVMAISIQREVGGNLAELLMTVSQTMVARERLRRDVRALTAEGRISAIILGLLPIGLGVVMYAINPKYMGTLVHDSIGQIALIAAAVVAAFGFWWMKKTIEIEV
jgi:tight adherence protein B